MHANTGIGFTRILVGTDFSDHSRHAIERAALLAKRCGAELRLVHAVPEASLLARLLRQERDLQARMAHGAGASLQAACAQIEQRLGFAPSWAIHFGRSSRAVLDAHREFRADLLVLGAQGEGESSFLNTLGGTALKLLSQCSTPVLLVRTAALDQYRRLLIAVDDSASAAQVLRAALPFAQRADCFIVHAFQVPYATRLRRLEVDDSAIDAYALEQREAIHRSLHAMIAAAGLAERPEPIIQRGDAMTVVLQQLGRLGPDLVIVGRHGAPHLEGQVSMLGSVALRVMLTASCDVLQVR